MAMETILDAVAVKVGGVAGIKRAYGAGTTLAPLMPDDLPDSPAAIVLWTGAMVSAGNWEVLEHTFEVRVYAARADVGNAVKTLVPFLNLIVAAWRSDVDLGGSCQVSVVTGAGRIESEEIGGKPYLVLPVYVQALEAAGRTYTA